MPTYEYECRACKHRFDHMQGFHDPVLRKCPECGRMMLQRLLGSGGGIVFKGSGFYETDYKRKGSPAGTDKGSPAGTDKGAPAGTDKGAVKDTKPESGDKSGSSKPPGKDD